jgi:hypothetical protein
VERILHDIASPTRSYPTKSAVWNSSGAGFMKTNQLADVLPLYIRQWQLESIDHG